LAESLISEIEAEQKRHVDKSRSKKYLTTPNILYVRDAIRALDEKKAAEIDKIWRSHNHDAKKLLKDMGQRLDQPDPRSSSPVLPPQESPTTNNFFLWILMVLPTRLGVFS
jgi:hypothetical protein